MTDRHTPSAPDDPDAPDARDPRPTDPNPGERRLARPPSDRYRAAAAREAAVAVPDPGASTARGAALALVAAIVGAGAIVLLGGRLSISAGLIIVAAAAGWAIATALRYGAGGHLAPRRRVAIAIALALGAVLLGQLGLWQSARAEGGVLDPVEFLLEVYGPLVPIELGAAAILAWLGAR